MSTSSRSAKVPPKAATQKAPASVSSRAPAAAPKPPLSTTSKTSQKGSVASKTSAAPAKPTSTGTPAKPPSVVSGKPASSTAGPVKPSSSSSGVPNKPGASTPKGKTQSPGAVTPLKASQISNKAPPTPPSGLSKTPRGSQATPSLRDKSPGTKSHSEIPKNTAVQKVEGIPSLSSLNKSDLSQKNILPTSKDSESNLGGSQHSSKSNALSSQGIIKPKGAIPNSKTRSRAGTDHEAEEHKRNLNFSDLKENSIGRTTEPKRLKGSVDNENFVKILGNEDDRMISDPKFFSVQPGANQDQCPTDNSGLEYQNSPVKERIESVNQSSSIVEEEAKTQKGQVDVSSSKELRNYQTIQTFGTLKPADSKQSEYFNLDANRPSVDANRPSVDQPFGVCGTKDSSKPDNQFCSDPPLFTVQDLQDNSPNRVETPLPTFKNASSTQTSPKNAVSFIPDQTPVEPVPRAEREGVNIEKMAIRVDESDLNRMRRFATQLQLLSMENSRLQEDLISKDEAIAKLSQDLHETTKLFSEIPLLRMKIVLMGMELERLSESNEELKNLKEENEHLKQENFTLARSSSEYKEELEKVSVQWAKNSSESRQVSAQEKMDLIVSIQTKEREFQEKFEEQMGEIRRKHKEELDEVQMSVQEANNALEKTWGSRLASAQADFLKRENSLKLKHEEEIQIFKSEISKLNEEITVRIQKEITKWEESRLSGQKKEQRAELQRLLEESNARNHDLESRLRSLKMEEARLSSEKESLQSQNMTFEMEIKRLGAFQARAASLEKDFSQILIEKQLSEAEAMRLKSLYEHLDDEYKTLEAKFNALRDLRAKSEQNIGFIGQLESQIKGLQERLDHETRLKEMHETDANGLRKNLLEQDQEVIRLRQSLAKSEHLLSMAELMQSEKQSQKEVGVMEVRFEMQAQASKLRRLYEESLRKKEEEISLLKMHIEEISHSRSFQTKRDIFEVPVQETLRFEQPSFRGYDETDLMIRDSEMRTREIEMENERLRENILSLKMKTNHEVF